MVIPKPESYSSFRLKKKLWKMWEGYFTKNIQELYFNPDLYTDFNNTTLTTTIYIDPISYDD